MATDKRVLPALMLVGAIVYFFAEKLGLGSGAATVGLYTFIGGVAIMLGSRLGLE